MTTSHSQQTLRDIATQAYIYFYPLLTMDVTRRQMTNAPLDVAKFVGPMNGFVNIPAYPPADFKGVVRPNFDTLYSSAWLKITTEPIVLSLPDTGGRYYLMPMLDMWTDVFASPGWRTTGTRAANYLIVSPQWRGAVPDGMTRIDAPTPYAWIIGRTQTDGPPDYDAVRAIQAGYKLTPLSQWGKPAAVAQQPDIDPSVDMKTPPKIQIDGMPAERFFTYALDLTTVNPPHATDQPIVAQLRGLGIDVGHKLDFNALDSDVRQALASAKDDAQALLQSQLPKIATVVDGWQMNVNTMGVYGNYYVKRAIVAAQGLGANVPEDAIYPLNLCDATGRPLSGDQRYVIHFASGALPPSNAFWSLTLYDNDGFQVANELNRFAISSWMPLQKNADGSLDLYIRHDNPGSDNAANWLPAPPARSISRCVCMRPIRRL